MFGSMNTREQGDLGEASAIEWLASKGAAIYLPFGHSPDVDLVAWWDGRLVGVQVKTTLRRTPGGRWQPMLCTKGGNQSWGGVSKLFDASRCDYLFVLVGDGRRWFIPAAAVEARTAIVLGGPKYAEFEVERGRPILSAAA
jgi:hypothetical protein